MIVQIFAIYLIAAFALHGADTTKDLLEKTASIREQEVVPLRERLAAAQKLTDLDQAAKEAALVEGEFKKLAPGLKSTRTALEACGYLGGLYARLAERSARENRWNQARQEALRALSFDPNQSLAEQVRAQAEEMLRRGAVTSDKLNPALTDEFFGKLQIIREDLKRGESLRETGQLDEAERAFQRVLVLDPFNEAAVAGLKKIHEEKFMVAEKRRDMVFQQKKKEVRELFSDLVDLNSRSPDGKGSFSTQLDKSQEERTRTRLQAIQVPEINFPALDLESVRRALNALAAKYDSSPGQEGPLRFEISAELADREVPPVTLRLRNASLSEIVRYVDQIAGVKARPDLAGGITFGPVVREGDISLRNFLRVSPSFFLPEGKKESEEGPAKVRGGIGLVSGRESATAGTQGSPQQYLEKLGVDFSDPKSYAIYNSNSKILTVVNTPEMLELVGNLIAAAQESTLLIKIDCRLVEINQTDLDSLTVNSTLGSQQSLDFNPFPQGLTPQSTGNTPPPSGQQGVTMQLNQVQGVGLLPNNTIQSFLAPGVLAGPNQASSYQLNTMQLGGSIMGGTQFRTLITALSQKSSANVLASPSIVLNRGQKGSIEVSQGFRFVQEYNDPQSSIRTFIPFGAAAGVGGIVTPIPGPETVISAFPSQISDVVPIGVRMGVKPDITGDNTRTLLELEPTFVDFEGFINYGAVVNSSYAATYFGSATPILTNNIQQPVFVRRDLVLPPLEVKDGNTLSLGGLLREDIQTIDEKVPVFGDIPLLGRAFQGKTEQAIKKNTLIFVTPRILKTDGTPLNSTAGEEGSAEGLASVPSSSSVAN